MEADPVLGDGVIKNGDAVAIGDLYDLACKNLGNKRRLLGGLLLGSCGSRLTRLAVLIVRAVVAVACIPTDIATTIRGTTVSAGAA